ncbi:fimbrial-like protein, partial [Escherichia coli]
NVLNASGGSRSVYPVMSDDMNGSSWKFSTRMQKIDPALSVTSGQLMSHVLVDIYYE